MLELTFEDLIPHKIKAHRTKNVFEVKGLEMNGTISITETIQGGGLNTGINFNIHDGTLIGYPFVSIFVLGNRLFLVPTFSDIDNYRLSSNPTSKCLNTKVGSNDGCNKLKKFLGEHKTFPYTIEDKAAVFVEI